MTPSSPGRRLRWRVAVPAALYLGWLGWLLYLALTASRPVVVSRPQLLASTLDVIAEVRAADGRPDARVTVREVHYPPSESGLAGQTLTVTNLADMGSEDGWAGPGAYILPLVKDGDAYRVATPAPSPGFPPTSPHARPRIYPATPETLHQLDDVRKEPPPPAGRPKE